MKIALPVAGKNVCLHFGHCEKFAFFEVDVNEKKILNKEYIAPPPHEPGVLPPWVKSHGASIVIAGGMGSRAQMLFNSVGINVITGAPSGDPEEIVLSYLNNSLLTGENACDH